MTDRATLQALLNRVLEGTGPDRGLEGEIEACLTGRVTHPSAPGWTFEPQDAEWKLARLAGSPFITRARRPAPPFTASLDAVLRDLLPEGWYAEIGTRPDWPWARLFRDAPLRVTDIVSGPTPPRALMAACLKARMEAQGE